VKSPVASLCFVCSSVRNLVSVIISVLIFSEPTAPASPLLSSFVAMSVKCEENVKVKVGIGVEVAGQLIEEYLPEDVKN
jgi:hypothetical protein